MIESITAVTQIDEIIFALKDRIVGINAGKWNYIFSIVKRFRHQINSQIDPRNLILPDAPFMTSFYQFVVYNAHKRESMR